ncbi:TatD family hydrolase [Beijerinckia indica]|uniref:Hydrolase, TatD family n=1 Tax=Beijerinckia indica subsp. indica (strain ATCC 9039 / DSM 1715 / NCIMB 8712) TaxID=395963 RepID=B2IB82_BEII9|nr:TatD family hydrolase [Beijerinckia indica]ACB95166.1 hydrolase, TatD family [Beijerinckia indica subsp. indica ATCC 9039]
MLIDTHCHLDFPDFAAERDEIVGRARAAGLGRMITISTRIDRFADILAIAETYHDVYCTVGTHPMHAHEEEEVELARLIQLSSHEKCIGIGETGLDYHYDDAPRDLAQRVFRTHIAAARETGLPLVIHSRDADADMADILTEEMGKGAFKALLHCFTSSAQLAETALKLGLSISFSGVLTFKKSDELRAIAREIPMDRLLVETDAPYLAPVPYRGKRNEPAYVAKTAKMLAEVKQVSEQEIASATTANALRLFSKMPPLAAAAGHVDGQAA